MLFRHQTMWLTVLHTTSVQSQVLMLSEGGATGRVGQGERKRERDLLLCCWQRHPVVKTWYYHFKTWTSQHILHIITLNIHCQTRLHIKDTKAFVCVVLMKWCEESSSLTHPFWDELWNIHSTAWQWTSSCSATVDKYSLRASRLHLGAPCRWSRQSEVSALISHLHISRWSLVSMARCHGFPWVMQLYF